MTNLMNAAAARPAGDTPPFGRIDPLVLAARLDAVRYTLTEADALVLVDKRAGSRELLAEATAVLTELSRSQRQESDRLQHEARGDTAVMRAISPAHRPDRYLTPTGQMPAMPPLQSAPLPMPPASGYEQLIKDASADRSVLPLRVRARSSFSAGRVAFIVGVASFAGVLAAVGNGVSL